MKETNVISFPNPEESFEDSLLSVLRQGAQDLLGMGAFTDEVQVLY